MKLKLVVIGFAAVLLALLASPASAQDGPSLTVDPATVDAAGEVEFTITGSGWTAAPPIFILPGPVVDGEPDSENLDTGNLTPATPDADGNFEVTATYDVPAEGIAICGGDAGRTESACVVVTVGGDGGGEEAAADDSAEGEEELAQTGSESGLIAVVAFSAVILGAMVVGLGRRFNNA
ncbi:MAG: hypothetical protein KDB21_17040 [Acidimicrobiales bacterium]|nr:hypothetical protein [Acidimicrobiales bacterium]